MNTKEIKILYNLLEQYNQEYKDCRVSDSISIDAIVALAKWNTVAKILELTLPIPTPHNDFVIILQSAPGVTDSEKSEIIKRLYPESEEAAMMCGRYPEYESRKSVK